MTSATLDRLLALLVVGQLVTGLLSLRAGSPPTAPLFVIHGLLGGALLVGVALKLKRSVPGALAAGRWGRLALGSLLAVLTVAALAGGFIWVASGRILSIGPWTVLSWHVFAALALIPIAAAHLIPRRWLLLRPRLRPGGPPISRRALLAGGVLAALGAVAWAGSNVLDAVQGGVRRFTGSRWLPDDGIPPPTTFFGETTGPIDSATWRLAVRGRVARPLELTLADLAALPEASSRAVLDCTSGWAMETEWRGVTMASVLEAAGVESGARQVTVRAVTGWYCRMPIEEARAGALLATRVAGQTLPHGNGAPLRLVAPHRRGLEWVKWVTEIEVA